MAQPILEDQALDFTKGFVLGYYEGNTYREKLTYPLKQSVQNMKQLGLTAPWDSQEVL